MYIGRRQQQFTGPRSNKTNNQFWILHGIKSYRSNKASNTAKSWLSLEHLPCELLLPHPDVRMYLCSIPLTSWHIFHSFSVNIRRNRAILCKSELVFFLNASIVRNDVVIFFFKSEQERIKKRNHFVIHRI